MQAARGPALELEEEEEIGEKSRNIHVVDQKEVAGNRPQGDTGLEEEGTIQRSTERLRNRSRDLRLRDRSCDLLVSVPGSIPSTGDKINVLNERT